MRRLNAQWTRKRRGIRFDSSSFLQSLRFADDLLIIAPTTRQAELMLGDLIHEASACGLDPGNTKVLRNGFGPQPAASHVKIGGQTFEILQREASTPYLGRLFSFSNSLDVELKNRCDKAWAKFAVFQTELIDWTYCLAHRMKLFKSIITPSVLYACSSWTLTKERMRMLRTTQRKMLRMVCGATRRICDDSEGNSSTESWLDWIQKTTRDAEQAMALYKVPDWVEESLRRKFR